MKKLFLILCVLSIIFCSAVPTEAALVTTLSDDEVKAFPCTKATYVAEDGTSLPYTLYLPKNYDPGKSYPLVLFFHGADMRGNDNLAQLGNRGAMSRLLTDEEREAHPCFILAPQCASGQKWVNVPSWQNTLYNRSEIADSPYMTATEELLDKIAASYSVDEGRLYVTGFSMGGYATWDIISRNPEKFAAAIPICGGLDPTLITGLTNLPIWTFHGDADTVVPPSGTIKANEILSPYGLFEYTEYAGVTHVAWFTAYREAALTDWLFSKVNTVAVTYPTVTGAEITGDASVHRNEKLSFSFELDDGYALKSLTVGGTKVSYTKTANGGTVEIPHYAGAQIKLDVRKIASVTASATVGGESGGGSVTIPQTALVGDTVRVVATPSEGYKLVELTVGGVKKITDSSGACLVKITAESTEIVATFAPINDGGEGGDSGDTGNGGSTGGDSSDTGNGGSTGGGSSAGGEGGSTGSGDAGNNGDAGNGDAGNGDAGDPFIESEPDNTPLIIASAIGGLAVIGAALFFILKKLRG